MITKLSEHILEVFSLSHELIRLDKYKTDLNLIQEKYVAIAKKYIEYPFLYYTWIDKLVQTQEKSAHYIEAGIATVQIIICIYDIIKTKWNFELDTSKLIFQTTSPCKITSVVTEYPFNEIGFVNHVWKAIRFFKESRMYDYSITIATFLNDYYIHLEEYQEVSKVYSELSELYSLKADPSVRYIGEYYYVAFYGTPFKDLNGKKYIYRSQLRLGEAINELKGCLGIGLDCEIIHIDCSKDIDNFDSNQPVIQISAAKRKNITKNEQSDTFEVDVPIIKSTNKKNATIENSWKKRMNIVVKTLLPSVLIREEIDDISIEELNPIECCIEDITKKCEEIEKQLTLISNNKKPNISTLQSLLQGSLIPQVNSGLMAYITLCHNESFDAVETKHLIQNIQQFLTLSKEALKIHEQYLESKYVKLHNKMMEGHSKTQEIISKEFYELINDSFC
ncbi:DOCKER domain-containing protein [Entamoeba marina]